MTHATTPSKQPIGPPRLQWLWQLTFGHGFGGGFVVGLCLTPFFMLLISWFWTGNTPPWEAQYKGFAVGDPLLAIATGLAAVLVARHSWPKTALSAAYWRQWLKLGLAVAALFIFTEVLQGKVNNWWYIVQPHIFYHHIILMTLYSALLGGSLWALWPHTWPQQRAVWCGIILCLGLYASMLVYDAVHPPAPRPAPALHSPATWFEQAMPRVD